ncbi:hypothetical protein J2T09_002214 [Neorhizobium huautlense]|uniref:Uncharacterized protein n=1 Tax=Neorhizobium huautlense TaxID=67774 RepID=A0ABT9PSM7_9HYPH|nr:hypothetical protein [Neorhizobium huautlense]MDP9837462.1 hypothetical protein [Neorhizobium huautlense]
MRAKSICRGMTAALLFVCAATIADARDHSLGSGNGPLGNNLGIQSYGGGESSTGYYTRARHDAFYGVRHGTIVSTRSAAYRTFVTIDGRDDAGKSSLAPRAKIIDVDPVAYNNAFAPRNGCVIESGVCVIRGDR